jgi:hypothetical protein
VESAGENKAACANATSSSGVLEGREADMACRHGFGGRRVHSPSGCLGQWMVSPEGHCIVHVVESNNTVHPASQRGLTATRDLFMVGNTSTCRAVGGRADRGSSAVWVECIICWFATWTESGVVVGWRLDSISVGAK